MAEFVVPLAAGVAPGDCANSMPAETSRRAQQAGKVRIGAEFMKRSSGDNTRIGWLEKGRGTWISYGHTVVGCMLERGISVMDRMRFGNLLSNGSSIPAQILEFHEKEAGWRKTRELRIPEITILLIFQVCSVESFIWRVEAEAI